MDEPFFASMVSSRTRLQIVGLLSVRPRTLRELSKASGVSVQAVLRHLKALTDLGMVEERGFRSREFPTRKLYAVKGMRISDFSVEDLIILKAKKEAPTRHAKVRDIQEIERLAEEVIVDRSRVKGRARRLAKAIDELIDSEVAIVGAIESLNLSDDERLVLQTLFTEDTTQDAVNVLSRVQGLPDARRSIDAALAKAKRIGK